MYKLHLILKYLRKRRIAWVSLIAVTLCTAMVLVVISVMGGWLRMLEGSIRGLSGDIVVSGGGLKGFAYYPQVLEGLKKIREVEAATPVISTLGLVNIDNQRTTVYSVYGYRLDEAGKVNQFPQSLYFQYKRYQDVADDPAQPPDKRREAATLAKTAAAKASFDRRFSPETYEGKVQGGGNWPGMIVGAGILDVRKTLGGKPVDRDDWKYLLPVTLAVSNVNARSPDEPGAMTSRAYWFVDDSQTGVPQMDDNAVYVPFDILQADLGMDAQPVTLEETGKPAIRPARVSEIHIKLKSGASPAEARQKIAALIQSVFTDAAAAEKRDGLPAWSEVRPVAQTWREHEAEWISPVENEKVLMIFLFAIISLVAVLLIFCIFYMIVAEKIRDIGIIKAVGASNAGVAGIFLGYGLAIGLVGAGVGWGVGYLIVHNINQLHAMAASMMGIEVFNSDSYIFDTIPNTMNTTETTITLCVAVIASMLGSVVPARRAARMHPVEALRWE